jgi:rhamnogalacturonan endolyase
MTASTRVYKALCRNSRTRLPGLALVVVSLFSAPSDTGAIETTIASPTAPAAVESRLPTLFIVGDSTVKTGTKGQMGWGDPIARLFDSSKINVENHARAGCSSRTFQTEGLWDKVLAATRPGDFVLMQFGHNDAGPLDDTNRARGTIPGIGDENREIYNPILRKREVVHTYGWYMRRYITDARARGMTPIVLSSVPRFPKQPVQPGDIETNNYVTWAAEVAESQKAFFINSNRIIMSRYASMAPADIKSKYFTPADNTHTSPAGAELNAESVVEGLRELKDCPLAAFLLAGPGPPAPPPGMAGDSQTSTRAANRELSAPMPSPAKVSERDNAVTLDNGIVSLTLAKRGGRISSIQFRRDDGQCIEMCSGRDSLYFDADGGRVHPVADADCQIVRAGPDMAEVVLAGKPSSRFPFESEMHLVLPRGQPGFYLYAVYRHGPGMAAGGIGETRFVIKGVPGTQIFTHHVVDDDRKGPFPVAGIVREVQDATWLLEDGSYYTKYNNAAFLADHHVHGMAGHGLGIWMIFASNEFIGGGPFKQELTVHKDNTLLAMLVGGHFGSGGLRFKADEPWDKVYGPVFVYFNQGASVEALWEDAKQRAETEVATWPYAWLKRADYPTERGTVSGRVTLADGTDARGAWAMLVPPDEDWTQVIKGYDYWARVGPDGRFVLSNVRPGCYALVFAGANQFDEFRVPNVEVKAGGTDLGELTWQPVKHGRTLWQIGVADRSAGEFKGGDNYRHYENFLRYPREFPEDVTFDVGKSKEREDWNFAQWAWYSRKPCWTIRFDLTNSCKGNATLTLGFASVNPPHGKVTNLEVKVNGREVLVVHLAKSGAAGYRSGDEDSRYNVVCVPFDAALLRPGRNEITLGHAEAKPFPADAQRKGVPGEVMYDALRLEVANP